MTASRLRRLREEADTARARAREVQGQADAAYACHFREAFALTARAEQAEKEAATGVQDLQHLQIALEDTAGELTQARAKLKMMAQRLEELSGPPPEDASVMLLLRYGQPHSLHPDKQAAYDYAATLGAPPSSWGPRGERPVAEVPWVCVPFIYDSARDHFRSVTAPTVEPLGGAA
ncbi:hypothetical protein [Streptomyces sp. G7(2002)]|uniref:hypothetical protein n=1 Tax=Streptomyces sp. G7(2002) TaxID=2971798 RepID=UPI00237E0E4F|nr:hypothetical protein [Streptomyces sp. G7(2002)]WDT55773.1 tropomyosin [Streptomyces sp. G7(2002)]